MGGGGGQTPQTQVPVVATLTTEDQHLCLGTRAPGGSTVAAREDGGRIGSGRDCGRRWRGRGWGRNAAAQQEEGKGNALCGAGHGQHPGWKENRSLPAGNLKKWPNRWS